MQSLSRVGQNRASERKALLAGCSILCSILVVHFFHSKITAEYKHQWHINKDVAST